MQTTLLTDWQYQWSTFEPSKGVWHRLELPAHPTPATGPVLLAKTQLPAERLPDTCVAFDAILGPFEAAIDGVVFFRFPEEGLQTRFPPGVPWQVLSLPEGSEGKTLSLRIRSDGISTPIRGTPRYTSRAELLTWAVVRDVPRLAIALLITFLGGLGAAMAGRRLWGAVLCTLMLGLYVAHYTHLKDVLLDAPQFWFAVWAIAVPAQLIGASAFLRALFPEARSFKQLLRVHVGFAAILVAAHTTAFVLYVVGPRETGVLVFSIATTALRALVGATVIIACVELARRRDTEARIFLGGLLALALSAVLDLLAAFGVAALSWRSQVHLGALALATAFAIILAQRYANARALAISQAKEKERMLRDLHDGVGGLTTNVRMLAELGKRQKSRAESALSSIIELSDTALSELRTLVRTLDDNDVTWDGLAGELRSQGAQLTESVGASFAMQHMIDNSNRPQGLVVLALLRIFREAVTNACKQAEVSQVRVALQVSDSALKLIVENDGGTGERRQGVSAQRGVNNMRSRAAEVGGRLELELGENARLMFEAPL